MTFAKNIILLCFLFFSFSFPAVIAQILLYFILILIVLQNSEFLQEYQSKYVKAEIKRHPITVEAEIRKSSI